MHGSGAREPFANGYPDRADPFAALNRPFEPPHEPDFDERVPRDRHWGRRAHRTREGYAHDQGRSPPAGSRRGASLPSPGEYFGLGKRARRD